MNIKSFFIIFLLSTQAFAQGNKVKIYPFKSAIIEYKYEASFGGTRIKYIDENGYKQADYIKKELNFGSSSEKEYKTVILIGDKAYTINFQDSTVAIGRNSTYAYYLQNQDINCTDISEAILRAANECHFNNTTEFLKKNCKVWKSEKSTLVTWNGLELKSEVNFMTMMVEKAVKIKVDNKVPKKVFDIPQGFRYVSSDIYQGFSGLELDFGYEDSIPEVDAKQMAVSFSTRSLDDSDNFEYFKSNGEKVIIEGVNDYNKIDYRLIKSQQTFMSTSKVELGCTVTLIFETQEGSLGKMQLKQVEEKGYELRYVVFNSDGTINTYSKGTDEFLKDDFKIALDGDNNKLIIVPKGKAKCFVLGF